MNPHFRRAMGAFGVALVCAAAAAAINAKFVLAIALFAASGVLALGAARS